MLLMWGFMSSDVGLTLGTNCKKLKTKDWGGGGVGGLLQLQYM